MALALSCSTRGIVSTFVRGATPFLATLSPVADAAVRVLSLPTASTATVHLSTYSHHTYSPEIPMMTLRPQLPRERQGPSCPATGGRRDSPHAGGCEPPPCSHGVGVDAEDPQRGCRRRQLFVAPTSPCRQQQQQQPQPQPPTVKSAKRQAAEALLEARFGAPLRSGSPPITITTTTVMAITTNTTTTTGAAFLGCPLAARARVVVAAADVPIIGTRRPLSASASGSDASSSTDLTASESDITAGAASSSLGRIIPAQHRLMQRSLDALGRATAAAAAATAATIAAAPHPPAGRRRSSTPVAPHRPQLHPSSLHTPHVPQQEGPPAAKRPRVSLSNAAAQSLGGRHPRAPHTCPDLGPGSAQPQLQSPVRPATVVAPCDPGRSCSREGYTAPAGEPGPGPGSEGAAAGAGAASGNGSGSTKGGSRAWCNFEVRVPPVNWQAVLDEPPGALQRYSLAPGYEKLQLPEGLTAYVVESPRHVEDALKKLRAGMQDPVIAIDLEWRPETVPGRSSPVALVQLSSATVCLALRVSCMGYALPEAVSAFLSEPSMVLLGFGWEGSDEAKMRGTFGLGRSSFRRFLDLQEVAACLGYPRHYGLARLAEVVLGTPMNKSKSVTRSNWAAPRLTNHQLKYASLDVLVAGQLFRALRLWHSSPSPCAGCRHPIGEVLPLDRIHCAEPTCKANFADLQSHLLHCASTGHKPRFGTCRACARTHELAKAAGPTER